MDTRHNKRMLIVYYSFYELKKNNLRNHDKKINIQSQIIINNELNVFYKKLSSMNDIPDRYLHHIDGSFN